MGGRGAHLSRNENGRMTILNYKTIGVIRLHIQDSNGNTIPHVVKILEPDVNKTAGAKGRPTYSNAPSATYAILKDGIIHQIRMYGENYEPVRDIEIHGIQNGDPRQVLHKHEYPNGVKDFKNAHKYAQKHGHDIISDAAVQCAAYVEIVNLVGRSIQDIPNYMEIKRQ